MGNNLGAERFARSSERGRAYRAWPHRPDTIALVVTEPKDDPGELAWSSWVHAAWLIARGATWRVALPVALTVGTVLAAVNQGGELLTGDLNTGSLIRVAANYAIPYAVSSIGYVAGRRKPGAGDSSRRQVR